MTDESKAIKARKKALEWIKAHPDKARANAARFDERRKSRQVEVIEEWQRAGEPTMPVAIKRFCRCFCPHGMKRNMDFKRISCELYCELLDCPLHPFRYGDPKRIMQGKKLRNICAAHAREA